MLTQNRMEDRRKRADMIIADPSNHKVCEGCESIVVKKATTCPSCHGYRFDDQEIRVIEQARYLSSRPALSVTNQDYQWFDNQSVIKTPQKE